MLYPTGLKIAPNISKEGIYTDFPFDREGNETSPELTAKWDTGLVNLSAIVPQYNITMQTQNIGFFYSSQYPDEVKFVYRDFPIFGEESYRAGMATECAEEQGHFWDFHDRLFVRLIENEGTPLNDETFISYADELDMDTEAFTECMATDRYAEEVLADYQAAQDYGLRGTPGFVINGVVQAIGAQPFEVFQQIIEAELALLDS